MLKQCVTGLVASLFFIGATHADSTIVSEKPIVIVTASYNNKDWYKKNLDSIFAQDYSNYRLIYWDDCSSDNTGELAAQYIRECGQEHRCLVVCNKERRTPCANEYIAAHLCPDRAIIVIVDGDDWLTRTDALSIVNQAYEDPNVWMTYGQFQWSAGWAGFCRDITPEESAAPRQSAWVFSHLRTSYAKLFKKIKLEDFMFNSRFLSAACDVAQQFPMVEMAGPEHRRFISDVLYLYNADTPLNEHTVCLGNQTNINLWVRNKAPYAPLTSLFDRLPKTPSYQTISIDQSRSAFLRQLAQCDSPYVLITDQDGISLSDQEVQRALTAMETTGGYAFYFTREKPCHAERLFDSLVAKPALYAWQFGFNHWSTPHECNTLYRTVDMIESFSSLNVDESSFKEAWLDACVDPSRVGLCTSTIESQALHILMPR